MRLLPWLFLWLAACGPGPELEKPAPPPDWPLSNLRHDPPPDPSREDGTHHPKKAAPTAEAQAAPEGVPEVAPDAVPEALPSAPSGEAEPAEAPEPAAPVQPPPE